MAKKKSPPNMSLPTVVEKLGASIEFQMELVNGNDGRGFDFHKSNNRRKHYERVFRGVGWVFRPLEYPVKIRVTRLIGPRQRYWDSMSVFSGNFKEVMDALVQCDWFVDDSFTWIKLAIPHQELRRDQPPGFRIEIFREDEQIVM